MSQYEKENFINIWVLRLVKLSVEFGPNSSFWVLINLFKIWIFFKTFSKLDFLSFSVFEFLSLPNFEFLSLVPTWLEFFQNFYFFSPVDFFSSFFVTIIFFVLQYIEFFLLLFKISFFFSFVSFKVDESCQKKKKSNCDKT